MARSDDDVDPGVAEIDDCVAERDRFGADCHPPEIGVEIDAGEYFAGARAQRSADLSALIQHLSTTTQALAAERTALGASLRELPPFMRLANTTFVNLRTALATLTPLVDVSKPVAPKLEALLVQLRPSAVRAAGIDPASSPPEAGGTPSKSFRHAERAGVFASARAH